LLKQEEEQGFLLPELREMSESCRKSTENVVLMVSNILDYGKMHNGNLKMVYQPEDPFSLVKNAVNLHASKAKLKGIQLITYCKEKIPNLMLDQCKLTQIIVNLISNAIKFTPSMKKITIKIKWLPAKDKDDEDRP